MAIFDLRCYGGANITKHMRIRFWVRGFWYRRIEIDALCCYVPCQHLEVAFFTIVNNQRIPYGIWRGSNIQNYKKEYLNDKQYYFTINLQTPIYIELPRLRKLYAEVRNQNGNTDNFGQLLSSPIHVFFS